MKEPFLILVMYLSGLCLEAQMIDNKIDLNIGSGVGKFRGAAIQNSEGFISSSLYSNYKNLYSLSFRGILLKMKYLDFGTSLNFTRASEWNCDSYTDYANSNSQIYSLNPIVRVHNAAKEYGILNRIKFFLETGPVIGLSKLSLATPLFDIHDSDNLVQQPDGSDDLYYGMKGTAGMEVFVNQTLGAFIEYTYGYSFVSSKFYADTHFSYQAVEAGIILRLMKDKRFFY